VKKCYPKKSIIKAIKEHEAGTKVDDIDRKLNLSSGTFYNWLNPYAKLEVEAMKDVLSKKW
jgi:putative transposase